MTAPTPKQFDTQLAATFARMRVRLEAIHAVYAVAYRASLSQRVVDSAGRSSGVSDPTGNVGFDHPAIRPHAQASIRRALEAAPTKLAEAENCLVAIEAKIERSMNRLDPRESMTVEMWDHQGPGPAEMQRLRDAQARRKAAGEIE